MTEALIVLSGTLRKSPPEHKLMRTWQKRYFVLTKDKQLQYFKSERDRRPVKDPIDLRSVTCIEASLQHKSFKHVFSINTRSRIYYLVADSQEEMDKWVEKLCEVCGFQKQSPRNSPDFAKILRNRKAATGQVAIGKKPSSMSPISSPGSKSFSPIFGSLSPPPCPLSQTMPVSKHRATSDPPEPRIPMHEYSGARKQSAPVVQAFKQYASSPALGTDRNIQEEHNLAYPQRPVSVTANYDLVPPPNNLEHRYSDYDIPPPPQMNGNDGEVYDMVPPPKPVGSSSNYLSDIYNDVPPPRPASDDDSYDYPPSATDKRFSGPQEVYDVVPPPRPSSGDSDSLSRGENYDTVPVPRNLSRERLSLSDHQENYDMVPSPKRAPGRLTPPSRSRPTSQEMYDKVPAPRQPLKFHRQLSQEHYNLVPAPRCPISSPSTGNGSLNSLFSSQCSILSENTQGDRDSGLYDVPPGSSDYDTPPSRGDEDVYDVPPNHKDDIYDVPPSSRSDDIYDVPPGSQGSEIYDVPPGCNNNDIYDVPPSQTDVYDVPPTTNEMYNSSKLGTAPPQINRNVKPPPVIDRSCKPKSGPADHSYANMPPPVLRGLKPAPEPSTMPHSYENLIGKKQLLRKVESLPGTPPRPHKSSGVARAHSMRQETFDADYCHMVPSRSESTRCYSLTKNTMKEEAYEDMGGMPTELRRESGYSDSTSSSDHDDDNGQYTNMNCPRSQQSEIPPALPPGGLRSRKRDIQYAEVAVTPGQMFPVPPSRSGPNTNYTTIDVNLSRGLQQTRNEKAQETIDS